MGEPAISSQNDPAKDEISFTCMENKTVWDIRAYIKFWDKKTKTYVKNADGKGDLIVNIIQKKNANPVVTIKWVYGITPPEENEKKAIEIPLSNPPEYHNSSYVFRWKETASTNFFNTRKMNPTGADRGRYPDSNQCWAKSASNMLHWWFEQNRDNISLYMTKKGIAGTEAEAYQSFYKRELPDEEEHKKSYIANVFRTKCNNGPRGSYISNGLKWYLFGLKDFAIDKNYSPELFKDVFDQEHTPIERKGAYTKREFEETLKNALNSPKAIGLNIHGHGYGHAITLWGAAFDEEGNVIAIYVVDNNFKDNEIFPYGIYYKKDIYTDYDENWPYLFNFGSNVADKDKHVGEITTLDKGEAQWKEWLNAH